MSKLTVYDPLRGMRLFNRAMNDLFDRSLGWPLIDREAETPGVMALDMREQDGSIVVEATLPGVQKDEVDVRIVGDMLTISAERKDEREEKDEGWYLQERRFGRIERSVRLPAEVKTDKVEAALKDGILTVTLPKSNPAPSRRIEVKMGK